MRRHAFLLLTLAVLAAGCISDDPFSPDNPGGEGYVTPLTAPELSWSATSFEATLGAANTFPTLSNAHGVSISYTSSNTAVATVSAAGAITLAGAGSTQITASTPGDSKYAAESVSYMLTVVSATADEPDDASLTFGSTGDPTSDDDISTTTFKGRIVITYSETDDATVTGDSYGYVTVAGNHVTVNNAKGELLIYELKGSSANGSFKVYGAKKQAIVLNGVSLTNPAGAALNNQNKKRTFIVVKGTNTLSDGASAAYAQVGEEDCKAVLFSEAQLIFSGGGLLTVNALNAQAKSGIATDDYIRVMDAPTIKVNAGASAGHGLRGKDCVQLSNGTLVISTAAAMKKGITSDDYVLVEGGTHQVTVSGGVAYDDEDAEYTGSACVRADNYFAMTGGSLTVRNTGNGGKGIHAGSYDFNAETHEISDSYISGGTLSVTVTGKEVNDVSAKGMKIGWVTKSGTGDRAKVTANAGNLLISGGSVTVNASNGEGLEVKGDLTFNGGQTYVSSTGDDAINCQGELNVNDGYVYAYSSANDAMDSNGNTKLNGGYVLAISTRGNPEVAIDANTEDGYKLYINAGATVVAYGGLERGYSSVQSIYTMSGTSGAWNALYAGKSYVAAFKAPAGISSFIVSAPSLSAGYKGVSVSGTPLCNGVWATSVISGGSSVSLSAYNGSDGGQGGPGGGGPGGGGFGPGW